MTQTPFQKDSNECLNNYRLELHDLRGVFKETPGDSNGHASKKWWDQTQMLSFWSRHFFTIMLSWANIKIASYFICYLRILDPYKQSIPNFSC